MLSAVREAGGSDRLNRAADKRRKEGHGRWRGILGLGYLETPRPLRLCGPAVAFAAGAAAPSAALRARPAAAAPGVACVRGFSCSNRSAGCGTRPARSATPAVEAPPTCLYLDLDSALALARAELAAEADKLQFGRYDASRVTIAPGRGAGTGLAICIDDESAPAAPRVCITQVVILSGPAEVATVASALEDIERASACDARAVVAAVAAAAPAVAAALGRSGDGGGHGGGVLPFLAPT